MRNTNLAVFVLFLSLTAVIGGFICPWDGYFANPDNEQAYYKCVAGTVFFATCPLEQFWIHRDQKCGWFSDRGT